MKLDKTKSVFSVLLFVLLAALLFGLIVVNGRLIYAEEASSSESGFSLIRSEGKNFIYSAEFATENDEAQSAGLVFGVSDDLDTYWTVVAAVNENKVKLCQSEYGELKTVVYPFDGSKKFKLTLVVNDETAKVFVNNGEVAVLTCKLEAYTGGRLGIDSADGWFDVSNVTVTQTDSIDGDIFFGGYDVLKVVNLTDGNYLLDSSEYSIKGGVLTVSDGYLKTLEANTEYVFRAVTSFTDFNFKIITDFTSVTATPSLEKYYRTNDVTLELSGSVKVNKLMIDGKECAFTQTDERVVISSKIISDLSVGKHSVKLYTDKGRPETTITVSEMVETISEPVVKSSHMWLWIDIAIFLSAIIGYVTFSVISKRKKK